MTLPLRTVVGTFSNPDGTPAAGSKILFGLQTSLVDAADDVTVIASSVEVVLDAEGSFSVELVPAADAVAPTPVYLVRELFGLLRKYSVTIPAGSGSVDLSDLAPIGTAPTPPSAYVLLGDYDAAVADLQAADATEATTRAAAVTAETTRAEAAETALTTSVGTKAAQTALDAEATARAAADALAVPLTQKAAANGVASLDSGGHIPDGQIPDSIARDTEVAAAVAALVNSAPSTLDTLGELATALQADESAATALAAAVAGKQPLDADLTAIANLDSSTAGAIGSDGAGWVKKTYAQVKTALGLVKADVGLGNVDNTADANKPVSTAQAAADATVIASSAQRASNLSDLASASTARTNLGLGSAATHAATEFAPVLAGIAARQASSVLPGPAVTSINGCAYVTGTNGQATGQTARNTYLAPAACTDLRLVWFGWYATSAGEQALAQTVTFKAAIEYQGTIMPVTMGGVRSLTIDPWGTCISDPLGLDLPAGATFQVRAFMNTPSSGQPFPQAIGTGGGAGITASGDGFSTGDVVDSGSITNANASRFNLWLPAVVCGRFIGAGKPGVALVGDSITRGSTASFGEAGSGFTWGWRGLNALFPSINLGVPSETAQTAASATGYARRSTLLAHCKYAIVLYGTNDFAIPRTALQIEADLTTIYTRLASRGLTVYAATLPPRTTTTDAWATTGNQTPNANEAIRVAVNTWIRTTPAPLAGYFETADTVESARDSGRWKVTGAANAYTIDGIHPSVTGHTAMGTAINTALFTGTG